MEENTMKKEEIKNESRDAENVNENKKQDVKQSDSKLLVEDRDIVVPGQILAEGFDYLPSHGTYRKDDNIIANRSAVVHLEGKVIKTIPLSGKYLPKKYDVIIGEVSDVMMSAWRLDINSPYSAVLSIRDINQRRGGFDRHNHGKTDASKLFCFGDYIFCKITNVTSQNLVDVTTDGPGLRKLYGGRVIYVNTNKVPRIIGKKGSMVNMIKNATNCKVVVGQNGVVWIQGEPEEEQLTVKTIRMIESQSHISGLTDKIKIFLEKVTGKSLDESNKPDENNNDEDRGN